MAQTPKRTKSETLSLRIDPKTKFMLELMSHVKGQSITTVIERSIRESADQVYIAKDDNESITWRDLWDPEDGVRKLNLLNCASYYTGFEEDKLKEFTKVHSTFFYGSTGRPKVHYVTILWPNIEKYLEIWEEKRRSDYWAAGKAMKEDLIQAKVAPPDNWPPSASPNQSTSFGRSKSPLDDDIPF